MYDKENPFANPLNAVSPTNSQFYVLYDSPDGTHTDYFDNEAMARAFCVGRATLFGSTQAELYDIDGNILGVYKKPSS